MAIAEKITHDEIIERVDHLAGRIDRLEEKMDRRFEAVDERFDVLESVLVDYTGNLEKRLDNLVTKDYLEERLERLESSLATKFVTKGYLDDKFADFKADLWGMIKTIVPAPAPAF